ncbi:MAG: YDG domain-containing protein, partial [Chloroflexi bacterium]|nr:YDG domain-containing protein [Chloroflexota bacterium]
MTPSYTSATFADKNVGTGKSVSVSGISIGGTDAGNYNSLNTVTSTSADITARALTVSATGIDKVYDGSTTATVNLSDDRVAGDAVTLGYSASFADKHVGNGKSFSVSAIAITGGADQYNYTLANTTTSTTANITARPITVTAATDSKTYDRTSASAGQPTVTTGSIANLDTGNFTQSFDSKLVGTGKTITPAGSVSDGNSGNNYSITFVAVNTGVITARALTVSATGISKTYDGYITATATLLDDRVGGDVFDDNYSSAIFNTKNVGTGKSVSVSGISISGADAGNYALQNSSANTTANITPRALTVGAAGVNKVYDGSINATV